VVHHLAGQVPPAEFLEDITALKEAYYSGPQSLPQGLEPVSFGTSGHRGTSKKNSFNEAHIAAITEAIVEHRRKNEITGPLFVGRDTHALSEVAERTVLQVLSSHGVKAHVAHDGGATPTPAISHAILSQNKDSRSPRGDGIIITPSHNPPADGGLKYNPPHGGPADTDVTNSIQERANHILSSEQALSKSTLKSSNLEGKETKYNFIERYVSDLESVIDIEAIREARVTIGVNPLGGAALTYWEAIKSKYDLNITIVDSTVDPTFRMVPIDHDGKIRMDCSSPYAMAGLVALKDEFRIGVGSDPDADRHGIVVPSQGLLNPNHYLAVAIQYLLTHRPDWSPSAAIGKTLVSSAIIDRVVRSLGRKLVEVPVGFKWFVPGLLSGEVVFGGEESAGASFLCFDGRPWSTDKDGILLCLLAAEITAVTGRDPGEHYRDIITKLGEPSYTRVDQPASKEQKERLKSLTAETLGLQSLGGEPIRAVLTRASGNGAAIGGVKIETESGWCAVRPSGTEDICKLYAESFKGHEHLQQIVKEGAKLLSGKSE
jgi:phosphoglucomutase